MRLIGVNGEQVGIVPTPQAIKMAEEAEVDLVEIAPLAKPPVCKLMDYGKFKYREAKKAHEAKLKQKQIHVKEVKFRPGTDEGDKTKVTLRYRGREMAHQEFGVRLIERVKQDLEPHAVVEQYPKMEGRQLIMVLAPKKGKKEIKKPVKKEVKKEIKKEPKPVVSP